MDITKLFSLLFLLSLAISCKESSTEPETKKILNTLWILESFEVDGGRIAPPNDQIYNIQFFADSTMKGISDCNNIFGNYKITSINIKFDSLFTTEVECGNLSMDNTYFYALSMTESFNIENNKLSFYYGEISILTFIGE